MYTNMKTEGPPTGMNLQFALAHKVALKDDNDVKHCSIYWCAFSWSKSNFLWQLNMKLDLHFSTTYAKFSANDQSLV